MANAEINQQLVQEAAEWIVFLSSDDEQVRNTAQQQFSQWKSLSLEHRQIATDIEQYLNIIQKISKNQTQKKLTQSVLKAGLQAVKSQKNWRVGSAFALIFCLSGSLYAYLQFNPLSYLTAKYKAQTGEWNTHTLSDGSRLILRGKTAVNLQFSQNQRVVELVQGEIYVDVAKDKTRPFIVKTSHGQIQALGTVFSVHYLTDLTELKMLHSRVKVQVSPQVTHHAVARQLAIVSAGQQVNIASDGIHDLKNLNIRHEQQKWQQHQLMVENLSLAKVLEQLDQQYTGKILFNSDQLSQIQVNAVLPLDQPDQALTLLSTVFPNLEIYRITPYLVVVKLK